MNQDLLTLFDDWRRLEQPNLLAGGAPDYSGAALRPRQLALGACQRRHAAMDTAGWPVEHRVDHQLIRAEMNGLDFNLRVLQPWARDPAFYKSVWTSQSDTPAHEGPTHHALVELWTYRFPLTPAEQERLAAAVATIAPLLEQARTNLVGDARDLWLAGIVTMREQVSALNALANRALADGTAPALRTAIAGAGLATQSFIAWLEQQAPHKSGPSGVGKEHYSWYQRNVHLVPLGWDEEVALLQRELARAHASLRLEEHRNRDLPALPVIDTAQEYQRRAHQGVTKYMAFLRERQILPLRDYMEPALRAQIGEFAPEETRNFFAIARQHEPMTLWTHWYHWFEVAQMLVEPHASPVRRGPLLFNIFDSRAEGLATAMEEMMMHAGLYDDNPRAREVVWIMLAQRAARGLASLYAQANQFTLQQAQDFHVSWTPRGWMRPDLPLLQFEQHLYLRQPGYGTSYVTGKIMIERLLADYARQRGDAFALSDFFAAVNAAGIIPVALLRWQLTGLDDDMRTLGLAPSAAA
jgi:hypothetical protein